MNPGQVDAVTAEVHAAESGRQSVDRDHQTDNDPDDRTDQRAGNVSNHAALAPVSATQSDRHNGDFKCDSNSTPPLPPAVAGVETFGQTIRLIDGDTLLATARWIAPTSSVGSVQLLELHVDTKVRRAGHGRRVIQHLLDQAVKFHTARKTPLRRIWVGVGHKSQVIGRAFLTGEGFHHVGSAGGLFGDEDMLVYVKAYR